MISPPVVVAHREAGRLRRGRSWVSRDRLMGGLYGRAAGEIVEVVDSAREWVGRGFVEAEGPIAVRIATFDPREALDRRWVAARLRDAMGRRVRTGLTQVTNAFRLANAEGDGLPALALDWYEGHVVGLASNPGWAALEEATGAGLSALPGFRGFGWKRAPDTLGRAAPAARRGPSRHASCGPGSRGGGRVPTSSLQEAPGEGQGSRGVRRAEMCDDRSVPAPTRDSGPCDLSHREAGPPAADRYRHVTGVEPPDDLVVTIDGTRLYAGIRHGLNTGLFLDQRENRRVIAERCAGATLCNAFAYTGAFSVAAALAGAARVTTLDLARRAIDGARANFALNGIDAETHEFVVGDVFEEFARWARTGRHFDVVLLDPPSFATSPKRVFSSVQHYGELVSLACGICAPGGTLVASCNTANWARSAFVHALHAGVRTAGRTLRLLETRGLPPDFPVPAGLPEMEYLKFVIGGV